MGFEWDSVKADANLRKHNVDFADAATALEDPFAVYMLDERVDQEDRWIAFRMDALGRLLVVIYTWRDHTIRLISARIATPHERRQYEERK